MKTEEDQIQYWAHMLNESANTANSNSTSFYEVIKDLDTDKWNKVLDSVVNDCLSKHVQSNDDDLSIEIDGDDARFTVQCETRYHNGSYSYHATSDLDYFGYPDEDECYVEIRPADQMQLDRWMDDRGLSFELNTDPAESNFEEIGSATARYTDVFIGKLEVTDKQKTIDWINSL